MLSAMANQLPDRFTASPDPATVGTGLTIGFSNADLANQTVEVTINNGGEETQSLEIELDKDGNGTATWTVPEWPAVILTHESSQDHAVLIE